MNWSRTHGEELSNCCSTDKEGYLVVRLLESSWRLRFGRRVETRRHPFVRALPNPHRPRAENLASPGVGLSAGERSILGNGGFA